MAAQPGALQDRIKFGWPPLFTPPPPPTFIPKEAFLAGMGAINLYVAMHYSTAVWVNFKVWGGIGLFLLFALAQGVVLARYVTEPSR